MGLLDTLFPGSYDDGGLLGYLKRNTAALPTQKDENQSFLDALKQNQSDVPDLAPPSFWDNVPLPQAQAPQSPFAAGAAPVPGLGGTPSAVPGLSPPGAVPPMPAPINVGPAPGAQPGGPQWSPALDLAANGTGDVTTPAGAIPVQGQGLPGVQDQGGPVQAPFPGGNYPTGGNPLANFFNRTADALGSISRGGSLLGAVRNQYDDPAAMRNVQFQSIYQSLLANGVSKPQAYANATLAVLNPEAAKTILPEMLTSREKLTMVKDAFGNEVPYWSNEREQTLRPAIPGAGGNGVANANLPGGAGDIQSMTTNIEQTRAQGATPQQLYSLIPNPYREGVQAMVEGRGLPANLGRANIKPLMVLLAHSVDPTFDENQIASRQKGWNDWYGGGTSSDTARRLNQSAMHFGELVNDKMPQLPGHTVPALNWAQNAFNTQALGKGAENNFLVNAHALADELGALFKGHNLSDTEIRSWESGLNPNMSLEQQRGMAKTLLGLYRDGAAALEKKRVDSIGPVAAANKGPLLGPEAQRALKQIEDFAYGRTNPGTTAPSSLPAGWSVKVHP